MPARNVVGIEFTVTTEVSRTPPPSVITRPVPGDVARNFPVASMVPTPPSTHQTSPEVTELRYAS